MDLRKGLIISLIAHISVVIVMTLKVVFFPDVRIDLSQAVRVDMVALPDKMDALPEKEQAILKDENPAPKPEAIAEPEPEPETKKEPEAPKAEKPKELPQKETKEQDAVNLEKSKAKQKAALDKLKKLSALERIKQDVASDEQKKKQDKTKPPSTAPIKGRVLSAGTRLTGLDKLQSDNYLAQLDAKVKNQWTLPQWLIDKPFKARVLVRIDETGRVIYKVISQSSGNKTYDEYALTAVEKASPFGKVPDKFIDIYRVDGITFAFPD